MEMIRKNQEQKMKVMIDFFENQNVGLDQQLSSEQLHQIISNKLSGKEFDWVIFEQIWQRMKQQHLYGMSATSTPNQFIEYFFIAEDNLEQCILKEKQALQYLIDKPSLFQQQQSQQLQPYQQLEVLVESCNIDIQTYGINTILKIQINYQDQILKTTHKKVQQGYCRWNEILTIQKYDNTGDVIIYLVDNLGNIIANTMFAIGVIQDFQIHNEELDLYDLNGDKSEIKLNSSFQLKQLQVQNINNSQFKVDEYQIQLEKIKTDLQEYQNDLYLLKEPFFNNNHNNYQNIQSQHDLKHHNIFYQHKDDIIAVLFPQNKFNSKISEKHQQMHQYFIIIFLSWLFINMLVNFARTVFLDFILVSYSLFYFYGEIMDYRKILMIIILSIFSIISDIVWLCIFTNPWWNGPDSGQNQIILYNYSIQMHLQRFTVFMSFLLLFVKVVAIVITSVIYQITKTKQLNFQANYDDSQELPQ